MITKNFIKENSYYDSVTLMTISSKISSMDGVKNAAVMMGTDYNKNLMKDSGLLLEENLNADSNDMIIGVIAEDEEKAQLVIDEVDNELNKKNNPSSGGELKVKTLDTALEKINDLNFTVISIPGKYAKAEAEKALDNDLHVLMFSDNVPIEDEIELKDKAIEKGLLMMGPDCGTAIINGAALGFANIVSRGNIGMVAASGTGLQETSCIIDKRGSGLSQGLGTGGRDLKEQVGGKMMMVGIDALAEDDETKVILLVSKPPAEKVMKKILDRVETINKPVIACFLGGDPEVVKDSKAIFAETLEDAAVMAVNASKGEKYQNIIFDRNIEEINNIVKNEIKNKKEEQKYIRALYTGGTLAYEGMLIVKKDIADIHSNISLEGTQKLNDVEKSEKNTFLDMGDDYFTDGRPHPMIDPRLRIDRIEEEARDSEVSVILLDIVLGYGSHEDPAGAAVKAIEEARQIAEKYGRHISFISSICGTDKDIQDFEDQKKKLVDAGVIVMESNAQAARLASLIINKVDNADNIGGK